MPLKYRCRICGEVHEAKNSSIRYTCDNPDCKRKYRNKPRTTKLFCKNCGGVIVPGSRGRIYCCKKCRMEYRKTRRADRIPAIDKSNRPICNMCNSNEHVNRNGTMPNGAMRWKCTKCNVRFVERDTPREVAVVWLNPL